MLSHQLLAGLCLIKQRERLQNGTLELLSGDPPGPLALPEDEVHLERVCTAQRFERTGSAVKLVLL